MRVGQARSLINAARVSGIEVNYKMRHAWRLKIGIHPFGLPLANNGKTCGDCIHAIAFQAGARWYKCDLMKNTGGTATDLKVGWPACVKWEERKK